MDVQYLSISWKEYLDLTHKMAASLLQHAPKFDRVIAVARGGLTLGHLLSDLLDIPVSTISIQSYSDIQVQGEIRLLEKLKTGISGQTILLADDVSDTGKTFKRALSYLKRLKPKKIVTVSMYLKHDSAYRPDFFVKEIPSKTWIIFPYETRETIFELTKKFAKEGKSKKEIQDILQSIGFTEDQIRFVRKYHIK